ncbi:hypothetical protein FB567DRAFT_228973 [Paraphoma chrysanthemicola]|uniref:F-box domain-containing protein n=1 Tax=Paraphoma chrysanthemicola TaxID=798071 RepID=A0A8K0RCT3_9PLEO|nr:hypothetical protein FB567DRAFT_228973 [Paraphoma chrysanthemicola]
MSFSLDRLPYDVLFQIASTLHLEDVVHLGQTCRQMKALLDERTLHRCVVETLPYTEETQLARSGHVTYKQALQAIYDRRNALSNAHPFSARVLGQGSTFLYRQGFICVLSGEIVRITNVRLLSNTVELNLRAIVDPIMDSVSTNPGSFKLSMLYYSDAILAVHAETDGRSNIGYIFAISTLKDPGQRRRVIRVVEVASNTKLFVRHTAQYLYYGTHTGIGDDGHHKWEITGVSLDDDPNFPKTERPLLLDNFHGTDIGSTVAFEIFDGQFHAVSNQGTFEVEEIDWTSFYHCVRFPLDKPTIPMLEKDEQVYRRQHAQGPIHDSWTDLSIQICEHTNQVVIVESRREWAQASSRQSRTFYTTAFKARRKRSSRMSSPSDDTDQDTPLLPTGDLYIPLLDSTNKPNFIPTPPQFSWSSHPEFTQDEVSPRSFILARTKFRAYNYSCTSFLDIVEDERCCNDQSKPPCLRLRVGSRRETYPTDEWASSKGKGRAGTDAFVDAHVKYRNSPTRMWPPPASRCPCSKRLHDIINPPLPTGQSHSRSIIGVLDERALVYMVKAGRSYGASDDTTMGTIVVVDFTRPWKPIDSTPHDPVTMARCDSMLESETKEADDFDPSHWRWTTNQKSLCRTQSCR